MMFDRCLLGSEAGDDGGVPTSFTVVPFQPLMGNEPRAIMRTFYVISSTFFQPLIGNGNP